MYIKQRKLILLLKINIDQIWQMLVEVEMVEVKVGVTPMIPMLC